MQQFDRSIWYNDLTDTVEVIDQRRLPFENVVYLLSNLEDTAFAIKEMVVRGAPLIGVTAAYGMYIATRDGHDPQSAARSLMATRPTAVNLKWAVDRQLGKIEGQPVTEWPAVLLKEAHLIAEEDIEMCSAIGDHGLQLIESVYARTERAVNILTHCNAGWLATVQWGTATAAIYKAHNKGIPLHIWVDETRPRNQGARLTAWELKQAGINFKVITDNAGGHLMQHGSVDLVIVGSDRTTYTGDVCNKIGTYLKALAAFDNNVPFYAALPSSTIDWEMTDGIRQIPIEERPSAEITHMNALVDGKRVSAGIMPIDTPTANYAFDVTPARLVTGIITERGISDASKEGLMSMFGV
ncbi:MAG: S-methyl-5-thioribose-1-phosphate isomerase [Bacteroidetes bacterium]|nr:S-methyl-5-thioribose-1-phosphate isomerase [Bacteroidota bacterium]